MIPASDSANEISEQPCSMAIKQALDNIDSAKTKQEEINREAVENLANMNVQEALMEVHQGTA